MLENTSPNLMVCPLSYDCEYDPAAENATTVSGIEIKVYKNKTIYKVTKLYIYNAGMAQVIL